ncbi:MAG: hypothetical protein RR197_01720 [Oscillospiraceae bacterium]
MKQAAILLAAVVLIGCARGDAPRRTAIRALERPFSGSGTLVWREQRYDAALTRSGDSLSVTLRSEDLIEPVTVSSSGGARELSQGKLSLRLPRSAAPAAGLPESLLRALERLAVCPLPEAKQGALRVQDGDCAAVLDSQTLAIKALEMGENSVRFSSFCYRGPNG